MHIVDKKGQGIFNLGRSKINFTTSQIVDCIILSASS